ncbi:MULTISPECIES: ParB N-terminal domain-containing protein [unclassified Pseudoalteromonas]|uniref:ParB N-terminal domain-containing protein n=1 Tax=unclassified Pseudoalteromonas TaxID=194690 RepID=UPI00301468F5
MARKRKNDTRMDPFATAVEGSSLDDLLDQAKVGDVVTMPAPSDPNKTIVLTCQIIPFSEIESRTCVYGQNRREQTLLGEKAVADILPAIEKDKRNLHPALCWEHNGKLQVLSGSRRRKACMLAKADYVVLSSADFSDEDAKVLAVSSDQYIAPSLWELGQAYAATKQRLVAQGQKGSYREIAAVEGVSHTAIADAIKAFESIPVDVLKLYPTANHLGREAAKKLINAKSDSPENFAERVRALPEQSFMNESMSDEKRALQITKFLTTFGENSSRVESILENDYVKLQRNLKSGDITVKIDNRVLTDKRLEQLQKLLGSYN